MAHQIDEKEVKCDFFFGFDYGLAIRVRRRGSCVGVLKEAKKKKK